MSKSRPKHVIDRLVEWGGAIGFGCGMAAATWLLASPVAAGIVGICSLAIGYVLITRAGRGQDREYAFDPTDLSFGEHQDDQRPGEDELLLNDPLVAADDSRVVRLFAAEASHPAALVARIEDYLDRDPDRRDRGQEMRRDEPVPDASAALHTALANIRASLR